MPSFTIMTRWTDLNMLRFFRGVLKDLHRAKTIKETNVPLITLDAYCCAASIRGIDFLKIDTEGNELKVLKGSQAMIQKNAIRAIQFEFNEMNVVSRVFLKDFYDILAGIFVLPSTTPWPTAAWTLFVPQRNICHSRTYLP